MNLLFVINQAPYRNAHVAELLDAALVGAVFGCQVTILFRGDGVWCLVPEQNAQPIGTKTISKVLTALPTYEINTVLVSRESVEERNLSSGQLTSADNLVTNSQIEALINQQDAVIGI